MHFFLGNQKTILINDMKEKISNKSKSYLNYLRYERSLSWKKIAEAIGMTRANFSNILSKRTSFSELTARKLGDFFKVDWKNFFQEDET